MSGSLVFSKLLEPGRLGKVVTRNRMIRSGAGVIFLKHVERGVGSTG